MPMPRIADWPDTGACRSRIFPARRATSLEAPSCGQVGMDASARHAPSASTRPRTVFVPPMSIPTTTSRMGGLHRLLVGGDVALHAVERDVQVAEDREEEGRLNPDGIGEGALNH